MVRPFSFCRSGWSVSSSPEPCLSAPPAVLPLPDTRPDLLGDRRWQPRGPPLRLIETSDMPASRNRLSRFLADSRPQCDPVLHSVSNFYREEFVKCKRCLEQQREFFSEGAISDAERALTKVMSQLDRLCTTADADQVVSRLLRQFDVVTRLSAL